MLNLKRRNRFGNGERYRRDRSRFFRPLRFEPLEDRRLLAIVPDLTFIETEVDNNNGVDGLNGLFDIVVSPDGKHVYTAGTLEDGLAAFSRDGNTGELTFIEALFDNTGGINGLDAIRSVAISPDGKHVYTAGLLDSAVATFARNATTGKLMFVEVDLDIGALVGLSGAAGVTVSPDGKHVYVAARTDNALSAYDRDATTGALTFIESKFDGIAGVNGLLNAERLTVSPDGKHVYVAAEGDNAVSVFSRDATTGKVTFVEAQVDGVGGVDGLHAATSVAVSPDGASVYVSSALNLSPLDEDWLATFSRDAITGKLTFINHISSTDPLPCTPAAAVFSDTVVTVSPDGKTVYASKAGALVQFSRNPGTGVLTAADAVCTSFDAGGLFAELLNPTSIALSPDGMQAYVGDLVGFLSAFHTQSRVFVVDATGDGADANLGDGICANGAGDCTLRAAIEQANATPNLVGRPDQILFDIPGSGPHTITPTTPLPTITEAVIIDGTSEPDFVLGGSPVVQLVGTSAGALANGLKITSGGSTVRGLAINRFSGAGIELRSGGGNVIEGNYIGTDVGGTLDRGNARDGVFIINSAANTIGGTTAAQRNVISGNDRHGVEIKNSSSTGNVVQGNYIGTNAAGTGDVGNSLSGVLILRAPSNTIGGTAFGAGNVISGNTQRGVYLSGAGSKRNLVQGNLIGTDVTGTADLGNRLSGVQISGRANLNTIGGTTAAARNVISGNNQHGVYLQGNGVRRNLVQGNFIGTAIDGTSDVGNRRSGVLLANVSRNRIGGTPSAAGNTIAFNGQNGVRVTGRGTSNQILRNSIFTNAGLGIDLNGDGVTANDANDPDTGPNKLQNFPVISSAVRSGNKLTVTYTVPSVSPNSKFPLRVEIFLADPAGQEGKTLLRVDRYTTPGVKVETFSAGPAVLGSKIVATATDAASNTSEFSASATVTSALVAAGGGVSSSVTAATKPAALTSAQLAPIVDTAISRLSAQGLTAAQVQQLASVTFAIADLPGATLGLSTPHSITLDVNAAGYGWFVDATPHDDAEFSSGSRLSPLDAQLHMDLLTAVMHELGHTLGLGDLHDHGLEDDLMYEALAVGVRRISFAASDGD